MNYKINFTSYKEGAIYYYYSEVEPFEIQADELISLIVENQNAPCIFLGKVKVIGDFTLPKVKLKDFNLGWAKIEKFSLGEAEIEAFSPYEANVKNFHCGNAKIEIFEGVCANIENFYCENIKIEFLYLDDIKIKNFDTGKAEIKNYEYLKRSEETGFTRFRYVNSNDIEKLPLILRTLND